MISRNSVRAAALELDPAHDLPRAVAAIIEWSRPFGPPRPDPEYYWAVVTWWAKFGAAAYGGSVPDFARSLPPRRFLDERFDLKLPDGRVVSAPLALALIDPPDGADLEAAAAHAVAYSIPERGLFPLLFRDPEFVREVILEFDSFVAWMAVQPAAPGVVPLLARYIVELERERPPGIALTELRPRFREWLQSKRMDTVARQRVEAILSPASAAATRPSSAREPSFDIDVYGHVGAPIGLGEDARLMAEALARVGYRVNCVEIDVEGPLAEPTAPVGFWAVPAPNFALRALRFTPAHDAQLKIIASPWELAETPASLGWVYRAVDVSCVYSDFVHASLPADVRARTIKLPMAFDCDAIEAFGAVAKSDVFTFITVFDFRSYLARKRPDRVIAAFRAAFAPDVPVRLVVKSIHGAEHPEALERLRGLGGDDPRISFLDEVLPKAGVLQLIAAAHAFVSLHSSEGFGRLLAESMLLDTNVVATDYSGSGEFCHPDTALLVPYKLTPLGPGDFLFGDGQSWASPDIDIAAQRLQQAYTQWQSAEMVRMRANAHAFVRAHYSLDAAASALRALLGAVLPASASRGGAG